MPEEKANYVDKAIAALHEIAEHGRQGAFDRFNHATKGERFILHFLADSDHAVLPSELSQALHSSTARISAILARLEEKGEIMREIDKQNRRNILVTVTPAGRERAKVEMRLMHDHLTQVLTELGETDTLELVRLLKKLKEIMQKMHVQSRDEEINDDQNS